MCIIINKYITFKSQVEFLVEPGLAWCGKRWFSSKIGKVRERRGEKRVNKGNGSTAKSKKQRESLEF